MPVVIFIPLYLKHLYTYIYIFTFHNITFDFSKTILTLDQSGLDVRSAYFIIIVGPF